LVTHCRNGTLLLDKDETNALLGEVSECQPEWERLTFICNRMGQHNAQYGSLRELMVEYMSPVK
jgi:hypothetical protein